MLPFISRQGGNKPQPACISTASISTSQMPAIEDFGWLWCSVKCIPKLLWWSFAVACYHTPIRSHAASWGGLKCGGWLWCAPRDLWREQHGHLATRTFFFSNQLRTWGTTVVGNDRVQPKSHLLHASTAVEAYTPTANSQVKNEAHTKPEQFSRSKMLNITRAHVLGTDSDPKMYRPAPASSLVQICSTSLGAP